MTTAAHSGFGIKSRRVLQVLDDGEWHHWHECWSLPNVAWGTINKMVAIGMIEERHDKYGHYREFRLSTTRETDDLGDLWVE